MEWKPVLEENRFKDIITSSLSFLSTDNRVVVYGFVIMRNHFHLVWQMMSAHNREKVQRDFLRFTSQQILKVLRTEQSPLQHELVVNAKDRKHQVWERNSLSVSLWSSRAMWQKIDYIHQNPVRAGLCRYAEEYEYSSASFYINVLVGEEHQQGRGVVRKYAPPKKITTKKEGLIYDQLRANPDLQG